MSDIDSERLWGESTGRAAANFRISGQMMPRLFLGALVAIKLAAAEVNASLGLLDPAKAEAIVSAAQEILAGEHWDQFPLDIYQTGSGTSSNMNCNEVIATLASRRLASEGFIHANDDVNLGQSSNDVVPTAMRIAFALAIQEQLTPALSRLSTALDRKSREFWKVIKLARTHYQDATPMRLGQEFTGWAGLVSLGRKRLLATLDELREVPLGGTAVGTGVNTHPRFAELVCRKLTERFGIGIVETSNHFGAQASLDGMIASHGAVRGAALALWKVASDIRLLATGPRAGLGELILPDSGVTSSIMPAKSPPAVIESLTMVIARVLGNDTVVGFAQTGSVLELNVMMPVVIAASLESVELLSTSVDNLTERCVVGIRATEQGRRNVENAVMLTTALSPEIGYDAAADISREALETGETVREVALRRGLSPKRLDELLDPAAMTEPSRSALWPTDETL